MLRSGRKRRGGAGGWFTQKNNVDDDEVTAESLYRKSQPSYEYAGGFVIESKEEEASSSKRPSNNNHDLSDSDQSEPEPEHGQNEEDTAVKNQQEANCNLPPYVFTHKSSEAGFPLCRDCDKDFPFSYLFDKFGFPVCDNCKPTKDYKMITRTTAKTDYLLKDEDFDLRLPKLKFISKKNPHDPRWGDMKLYLKIQVEHRALSLYESLSHIAQLKAERVQRASRQQQAKRDTQLKNLRRELTASSSAPSAIAKLAKNSNHQHNYGPEKYNKNTEEYEKQCTQCAHKLTYEKM